MPVTVPLNAERNLVPTTIPPALSFSTTTDGAVVPKIVQGQFCAVALTVIEMDGEDAVAV